MREASVDISDVSEAEGEFFFARIAALPGQDACMPNRDVRILVRMPVDPELRRVPAQIVRGGMARSAGFEPAASRLGIWRSIQLSYEREDAGLAPGPAIEQMPIGLMFVADGKAHELPVAGKIRGPAEVQIGFRIRALQAEDDVLASDLVDDAVDIPSAMKHAEYVAGLHGLSEFGEGHPLLDRILHRSASRRQGRECAGVNVDVAIEARRKTVLMDIPAGKVEFLRDFVNRLREMVGDLAICDLGVSGIKNEDLDDSAPG